MRTERYEILAQRGQDWARLIASLRRIERAVASIPENDEALLGALRATARCLQAGYGASAILLRWSFDDEMPDLIAGTPRERDMAWIWEEILDPQLVFWR
jgi:hypothetical protein